MDDTPPGYNRPHRQEGDEALALSRRSPGAALRNAAVFIAIVTAGFVVKYLQAIITPLVVAVFLLLLIDGFSRTVAHRAPRLPEWVRLTLAVALILAGFALIVGVFVHYGRIFAGETAALEPKLDALVETVCDRLQIPPMTVRDLFQQQSPQEAVGHAVAAARRVLSGALLTLIYLGFLLASRQASGRKMRHLFRSETRRGHATRVFERIRDASEAYVGLQTLKAAIVAGSAFVIMAALGLQNAVFLAFLIFLFAYVPIVGGFAGALLPTLLAFVQFDTPERPLILLFGLGAAIFLIENVLLPKLQSDRLNLDPVSILAALGFWGVLLGLPGALLSTPLTVVVMAVASEFDGARWLAVLLSKEGETTVE